MCLIVSKILITNMLTVNSGPRAQKQKLGSKGVEVNSPTKSSPHIGCNTVTDVLLMMAVSHSEKVKRRMPCILKGFPSKMTFKKLVFHLKYVSVTWKFTLAKTLIFLRVLDAGNFSLMSFTRKLYLYFYFHCSME